MFGDLFETAPRTRRALCSVALLLAVAAQPKLAAAQAEAGAAEEPPDPTDVRAPSSEDPENADSARRARELFMQGQTHFQAGEFEQAVESFQAAAELVPSADLWYNIARGYEELRRYDDAAEYYRRYLRDRIDPPDRARIETHIAELERAHEEQRRQARDVPTMGSLRVDVDQEGASVTVGGDDVGVSPLTDPLAIAPGLHTLRVNLDGYVPFRSDVRVLAGVTTLADVNLEPITNYRSVRGRRLFTWIVGALAVGALGASLGLGAYALRQKNSGDLERARDFSRYSDILLGSGLVLAVGSITLYFIEGRAVSSEMTRGPQ